MVERLCYDAGCTVVGGDVIVVEEINVKRGWQVQELAPLCQAFSQTSPNRIISAICSAKKFPSRRPKHFLHHFVTLKYLILRSRLSTYVSEYLFSLEHSVKSKNGDPKTKRVS